MVVEVEGVREWVHRGFAKCLTFTFRQKTIWKFSFISPTLQSFPSKLMCSIYNVHLLWSWGKLFSFLNTAAYFFYLKLSVAHQMDGIWGNVCHQKWLENVIALLMACWMASSKQNKRMNLGNFVKTHLASTFIFMVTMHASFMWCTHIYCVVWRDITLFLIRSTTNCFLIWNRKVQHASMRMHIV